MTDVIKNPKREISHSPIKYEPEYKRLNIEPIPMGEQNKEYNSFDADILDDNGEPIKFDNHIIDNNEFINLVLPSSKQSLGANKQSAISKPNIPNPGDYILMVLGKIVMSGSFSSIEERVKTIIYGEDKDFTNQSISIDDIVVLKRISIKVGIFLQE
jgi:hypothetical protein